ncbi:MAG: hypothetical protein WCC48_16905, partial [Anaeromyxobacteraceae bacterium]
MPVRRSATLIASALTLALSPLAAGADPATGCHCFRDRTFEPARPGAADPYVLATTRSSLLSAAYGVPKTELVGAVMTGTAPEELWIAHWSAARTRRTAATLLDARKVKGSWKAALAGAGSLGGAF